MKSYKYFMARFVNQRTLGSLSNYDDDNFKKQEV